MHLKGRTRGTKELVHQVPEGIAMNAGNDAQLDPRSHIFRAILVEHRDYPELQRLPDSGLNETNSRCSIRNLVRLPLDFND